MLIVVTNSPIIAHCASETIDRDKFIEATLAWPISGIHLFHAVVMIDRNQSVCYVAINVPDNNIKVGTVLLDKRRELEDGPIVINIYAQLEPLMCWRQETIDFHTKLYSYHVNISTNNAISTVQKEREDGGCNCSLKRQMVVNQELMDMVSMEYGIYLKGTHQEKLATLGQFFLNKEVGMYEEY